MDEATSEQLQLQETKRKYLSTQQALNNAVWAVCDIMRRSSCSGALQYIPELTWLLFLRILDERESEEATAALVRQQSYVPSLTYPYRWQDWAAPGGAKRQELQHRQETSLLPFVNEELLPHLKSFDNDPAATPRQKMVSGVLLAIERTRLDSERILLDALDKLNEIRTEDIDSTHIFPLSQVYEGLLLRMGEKSSDGGQFFTPREVVRAMVQTISPQPGETVYDPCCGTGGFLAQAYMQMWEGLGYPTLGTALQQLKRHTFYGREKDRLVYPIALANLVLHGIDEPQLWHGNTLTSAGANDGLFAEQAQQFDVILTNPPFGAKESADAKQNFQHKTGASQILFLQHVIDSLKPGGRCGIVLDEGVLFRTNEAAYMQTKRRLLEECDLWCIVSLPQGVFTAAGAFVKTNLLFFTKGRRTENIWYYDLSEVKIGRKTPLTMNHFEDFFQSLALRAVSRHSWTVTRQEFENKNYDLKAVNPNIRQETALRSQADIVCQIEAVGHDIASSLALLRQHVLFAEHKRDRL